MRAFYQTPAYLIVAIISCMVLGCNDSPTSSVQIQASPTLSVTGTVQNNTGGALPSNTRILVGWVVSSGSPDTSYLFGEGTIDHSNNTFSVTITSPPPPSALNSGGLGVGLIILTTNATVTEGQSIEDIADSEIVGAAGQYGMIYVQDENTGQTVSWVKDFGIGFTPGVGVPATSGFDSFAPVDGQSVIVEVGSISTIEFVNWT